MRKRKGKRQPVASISSIIYHPANRNTEGFVHIITIHGNLRLPGETAPPLCLGAFDLGMRYDPLGQIPYCAANAQASLNLV